MPRQPTPLSPAPHAGAAARLALLRAAKSALDGGDAAAAQKLLAEPLRRNPDDPVMLALAGTIHRSLRDNLGAVRLFERALGLTPDYDQARMLLADTLVEVNRAPDALALIDAFPARLRKTAAVMLTRARALGRLGDQPREVAQLRKIAAIDPANAAMRLRLGHALRAMGKVDGAIAQYRALLVAHPANGAAWWSIANIKSARFSASDEDAMRAAIADPAIGEDDHVRILFSLARAAEVGGDDDRAFALYEQANARRHLSSTHDPARFEQTLDAAGTVFTADFFAARPGHGATADAPIFIVGMQRSGSTLLEQMLSCHPAIEGTAELPHIGQLVREVQHDARLAGISFERHVAGFDAGSARALGELYLSRAAVHRHTDRPLFLDKMPNNWAQVGFIRLILPHARVIDVRRHPMACGYSNFRQLYASGLDHSYSLADWGRHYRTYVRFMDRIDTMLPGWVRRLTYEALVDDPDRSLRGVSAYLGIAFAPAMLDFYRSERTVRTISAEQVRRPLHRQAIDEWRRFEPGLAPLRDALGAAIDNWDAAPPKDQP